MKIQDIMQLPLYIQVVLASGFLAYLIARHGRRQREKNIDAFFSALAFGLPGLIILFVTHHFNLINFWKTLENFGKLWKTF